MASVNNKKYISKQKIQRIKENFDYRLPIITAIVDCTLILLEIFEYISEQDFYVNANLPDISFVAPLIYVPAIILTLMMIWKQATQKSEYLRLRKIEVLSVATLKALKDANEKKRRYILQTTYGNVPEWHPTDYTRNILTYDVHEQIRSILYSLRDVVIECTAGLSEDDITVDLVTCYPDKTYLGILPCDSSKDEERRWKIITSGRHSWGGSIMEFLNQNSFFAEVFENGYRFYNDKKDSIDNNYYKPSKRDIEFNNEGSIVGLGIELRSDAPETVFVKGILTITTYGKKLYTNERIDGISEEDFMAIFKEKILNSFEALLISEFAHMYIRHVLRDGKMCPKTGRLLINEIEINENSTDICPWSGEFCCFTNKYCT